MTDVRDELACEGKRLSIGQTALWMTDQLDSHRIDQSVSHCLRMASNVDRAALRHAYERACQRHPLLRSVFPFTPNGPVRRQGPGLSVREVSLDSEDAVKEYIRSSIGIPFDVEKGPLFRATILTAPTGIFLFYATHHIVWDQGSAIVFLRDLFEFYAAEVGGRAPPAALTPNDDFDRYVAQEAELLGTDGNELWPYWRAQLEGELPILDDSRLPLIGRRPPTRSFHGGREIVRLDASLTRALRVLAQRTDCRFSALIAATYHAFLHRSLDQEDLLVGFLVSNRPREMTNTVGYFINLLPIRTRLEKNPSFLDWLGRVTSTLADGLRHRAFPFSWMVGRTQKDQDASRPPLCQAVLSIQTSPMARGWDFNAFLPGETGGLSGVTLESVHNQSFALVDFMTMVAEVRGELVLDTRYSTSLFDSRSIRRMMDGYATLLSTVATDPECPVRRLPVISPEERRIVVVEANRPPVPAPPPPTEQLHQAIRGSRGPSSARRGRDVRGGESYVRRAQSTREPLGACVARAGDRPRDAGGYLHGPRDRPRRGNPRRSQKRRGLRAPRSHPSRGADSTCARGFARSACPHRRHGRARPSRHGGPRARRRRARPRE